VIYVIDRSYKLTMKFISYEETVKEKRVGIVVGVCVLISILVVLFGGGNKEVMTAETFKSTMETLDFKVTDMTERQNSKGGEQFESIQVAKNDTYQIELYNLSSVNKAKNLFVSFCASKSGEDREGLSETYHSSPFLNNSYYDVTENKEFISVYRVEDTLLYVKAPREYKEEIEDIFETLGH